MKVLHLYAGNLYGGIESYLATLARFRQECPHMEPEFGLCFKSRIWSELVDAGVVVHDLGEVKLRKLWQVAEARRRLAVVLANRAIDVAVCHSAWPCAIFATTVKRHQIPLATFIHDALGKPSLLDKLAAWSKPGLVLTNSNFTASTLGKIFKRSATEAIYLPVAPMSAELRTRKQSIRTRLRSELKTGNANCVILQASRMEPYKGALQFVRALAALKHVPNWEAWIAGGVQRPTEQSFFDELKVEIDSGGITGRIHLLGQRADVRELMIAADIYCQPNVAPEPFGISFVEALYAGLPVITTNHGGAAEIVDDSCGELVTPNDLPSLIGSLKSFIEDEGKRQRLGGEAGVRRAASLCNPKLQISRLADSLRSFIASSSRT